MNRKTKIAAAGLEQVLAGIEGCFTAIEEVHLPHLEDDKAAQEIRQLCQAGFSALQSLQHQLGMVPSVHQGVTETPLSPRRPSDKELKDLEEFIVSAREAENGQILSEVTHMSEQELARHFISESGIGVFEFGEKSGLLDGRVMVGVWSTFPVNASVFVWNKDCQLVEYYHCVGGPGIVSLPIG
jgi:hypothetical protein